MIYKSDSRHRVKRSILTGVVPTGREGDFTDGTWLNTEIRAGEFFYNVADERLWIGTNTTPLEISTATSSTLAGVLALGNTTGAYDIEITSGQVLKSTGSNCEIDLDFSDSLLLTNDGLTKSILLLSPTAAIIGYGAGTSGEFNATDIILQESTNLSTISIKSASGGEIGLSAEAIKLTGNITCSGTETSLTVPRLTTTQRNALTAVNGMIIYNTTTDRFQAYQNSSWVDMI